MITDGLSSLYDSVRSLEQLKGRLSPESAIPEEMQSGNPHQVHLIMYGEHYLKQLLMQQ